MTARYRSRHRKVTLLIGLVLAAAALALALVLTGALGLSSGQSGTGADVTATPSGQRASFTFVTSLFPATSAEFESGKATAWGEFVATIKDHEINACLRGLGYSLPSELVKIQPFGPPPVDNLQFPNIKMLEAGSFGTSSSPASSPGQGFRSSVPATVQAAWNRDKTTCTKKAGSPFTSVNAELKPIDAVWGHDLTQVMTTPKVRRALHAWKSCVARGGIAATTLSDFFGEVNNIVMGTSGPRPETSPQVRALAKLYGRCIGPVADAMDTVRLQDRSQILDRYATALDQIEQQMTALVDRMSGRYGVHYKS